MTVTMQPFTDEERRKCLRRLVTTQAGEGIKELVLATWAHPSLDGEARAEQWQEFAFRHRAYLALQDGTATWRDVYPDLLNGDREQAAMEMALQEADDALDVLVNGKPL